MIIVINTLHFSFKKQLLPGNDFYADALKSMAPGMAEHTFIFISRTQGSDSKNISNNVTVAVSYPKADKPLWWKLWLDFTLPPMLKKWKADLVIHTGGVCSLRTRVPQCIIMKALQPGSDPDPAQKQSSFFRRYNASFLHRSVAIIAASGWLKTMVAGKYKIAEQKIECIYPGIEDQYQPIDWREKEYLKEKYAEGKEYFFYTGDVPGMNMLALLKAFSLFKKRQKSNMQLLIAPTHLPEKSAFLQNLKTYKYREEVRIITDAPAGELAKLTAAAYALVYPVSGEFFPMVCLQAMQCNVPVICGNSSVFTEVLTDGVLNINSEEVEDIADKMMLVFKDENRRAEIRDRGRIRAESFRFTSATEVLHQLVHRRLAAITAPPADSTKKI